MPPLRRQIELGREPYAVFVGGGALNSDLYAIRSEGGSPIQITFSNVAEQKPALSPEGGRLAFLRGASLNDSAPATVWLMNLRSGSERELVLPSGAGSPQRLGWSGDGQIVIVETSEGLYRISPRPGPPDSRPVPEGDRSQAESSLAVLLGEPVFTRVVSCKTPRDLCVVGASGRIGLLAQGVRDPVRWGPDSVGFFVGDRLQIRPVRRGRPRLLMISNAPERPREMTFFPGSPETNE